MLSVKRPVESMRLITWNCNLNLKSKFEKIESLSPHIAVIQECEHLPKDYFPNATYYWTGRNEKKGLGILIFEGSGSVDSGFNEGLIYYLPIHSDFGSILGVWSFNHRAKQRFTGKVEGHIVPAIAHYKEFLEKESTIGVVGDFNNSVIWDKASSKHTFSNATHQLSEIGFDSTYHKMFAEDFGEEKLSTLFHTKNADKGYHIDYLFLRQHGVVTVGDFQDWIQYSDHMPMMVDMNL
jgi:exonuclease III